MRIESIADHLDLVPLIARWHFNEWGHLDPAATLEGWTEGVRQRTSRDSIPMTYVALEHGELLGSVTLVEHDMSIHQDLSHWVAGVYVPLSHRHQGVASALVRHTVQQAALMGVQRLYLYTHSARELYEKLGWQVVAEDEYEGQSVTIMTIDTTKE